MNADKTKRNAPKPTTETDPGIAIWADSLDAWLETAPGLEWLREMDDAHQMEHDAMNYGIRPGLAD